jgi:hypothetical protein
MALLVLQEPFWCRQPGESSKHYEKFRHYLESGPDRSILKTAHFWRKDGAFQKGLRADDHIPTNYSWFRQLARDFKWEVRAAAYQQVLDAERFALMQKQDKERTELALANVDQGNRVIAHQLHQLVDELEAGYARKIPFADLALAQERLMRLSQLLIGKPTERVSVENAALERERRLAQCVTDITEIANDYRAECDAPPELIAKFIERSIKDTIDGDYYGIDFSEDELRRALHVVEPLADEPSDAEN